MYLGGAISANRNVTIEITRRLQRCLGVLPAVQDGKSMIARVCAYG